MNTASEVRQMNPWWSEPSAICDDQHIVEWDKMAHTPDALYEIGQGGTLYLLKGTRYVGKTTLIKVMIKKLLDDGIDPLRILYCDADSLEDIQHAYDYHYGLINDPSIRRYIFLDGSINVVGWTNRISDMLNTLGSSTVIVSGHIDIDGFNDTISRMSDFRRVYQTDPQKPRNEFGGRRRDIVVLPMSFFEAAIQIDAGIGKFAKGNDMFTLSSRREIFDKLIRGEIDGRLEELAAHRERLDKVLDIYLATGGMPQAVHGYIRKGLSWDPMYEYHHAAISDMWNHIQHMNPDLLVRFGSWLAAYQSNIVSWDRLAKGTGITPPQMVLSYANMLEQFFVLHILYRYKDGRLDTRAAKKIVFTDPIYFHMFRHVADRHALPAPLYVPENRDKVLEGVVTTHLMKLGPLVTGKPDFDPRHSIFYWTDKKSRPVDFILDFGGDMLIPLKVQTSTVRRRDMSALTRFLNITKYGGLLLCSEELGMQRDYLTVPTSVFLMLA